LCRNSHNTTGVMLSQAKHLAVLKVRKTRSFGFASG
jgi:hypothetical protein